MPDEKDESSGFKVVDRRSFSVDGARREGEGADEESGHRPEPGEGHREQPRSPSAAVAAGPSLVESDSDRESEPEILDEPELTGFETLVSYFATTAWFQLGLLPGPGGERIPVDLPNARRTIDLLEVLEEKTQGNLTPGEGKMLEDMLYELRMGFVEVEKRGAPKRK